MVESASLLSFYLAFALLHGADPQRFPVRRRKPTRGLLHVMRLASVIAMIAGMALWACAEGLAAALLVGLGAISTAATIFILFAPLAPRVLWGLVLASPLLILALAVAGGSHD